MSADEQKGMDEIVSYKAWDTVDRKMVPVRHIVFDTNGVLISKGFWDHMSRPLLASTFLLPYIGIDDKNEKRIFLGDRLKVTYLLFPGTEKEEVERTFVGEVIYSTSSACYGITDEEDESGWVMFNHRSMIIEILGNIYEGLR